MSILFTLLLFTLFKEYIDLRGLVKRLLAFHLDLDEYEDHRETTRYVKFC